MSGDNRPVHCRTEIVAWVTPLIKSYNGPREHLKRHFGVEPFAGLAIVSVHLDPPALGIEGVGVVAFAADRGAPVRYKRMIMEVEAPGADRLRAGQYNLAESSMGDRIFGELDLDLAGSCSVTAITVVIAVCAS